jgi:CRP-like cAMP-binding protein
VEAINSIMRESSYLAGEVVFREGDPGGELYLLLEGKARIVKDHGTPDELILGRVEAPGYFGEMAALDDRPRSATVVFSDDARVLALNGDSFKDLMLQMPEIALEVCRELSERVRTLDAQMGRGAPNPGVAGAAPGL